MAIVFTTLTPIFALICLGYFLKKINFVSNFNVSSNEAEKINSNKNLDTNQLSTQSEVSFWNQLDRLIYFVLMPAFLLEKLASAETEINDFSFILVPAITILFLTILVLILKKFIHFEKSSFTSIFQGSIRFNAYIYITIISSLFGDAGVILGAIMITILIPVINILCITVFLINSKQKFNPKKFFIALVSNPLILSCVLGGSINYFDIKIPLVINSVLSLLAITSLPLGLLAIGANLKLRNIKVYMFKVIFASTIKLVLMPFLIYIFISLFEAILHYEYSSNNVLLHVLVLYGSMPTATSSHALAKNLGGDAPLMANIISIETLLSFLSITIILLLLQG